MEKPPVLVAAKSSQRNKSAWLLNLVVPGAGQLLQGQIALGSLFLVTFLADFISMMVLFVADFKRYLNLVLSGKILEGDTLEQVGNVYHMGWLFSLLTVGILIYIVSFVALAKSEATPKPHPA